MSDDRIAEVIRSVCLRIDEFWVAGTDVNDAELVAAESAVHAAARVEDLEAVRAALGAYGRRARQLCQGAS